MFQEPTFPRGGKLRKAKIEPKDEKKLVKYGVRTDHVEKRVKLSKKQRKALKIQTTEDQIEEIVANSADTLNRHNITTGLLILGVVKKIEEDHLDIALPGKLTGRVPVTAISESYTKAKPDEIQPLSKLFKRGQNVCVKVIDVQKKFISLSLKPSDINADKLHGMLQKGLVVCGAVSDIEDHGCTIDLGIKNVRAFLPMEKSRNLKLSIGGLVHGVIDEVTISATTSTVILKGTKGNDFDRMELDEEPNLNLIIPGTIIPFNLERTLKNGLQGKVFDTFTAYVNENYMTEPLHRPNDYTIGLQFETRLLYVAPLTKHCYLTMNFTKVLFPGDDGIFPAGHIVEEAVSLGRSGGQILFKINKQTKGAVSLKSVKAKFKGNYDEKTALLQYAKTTKHRLRILDYDVYERIYLCTDNEAILNQQFFSITDVSVGDFVEARVKVVEKKKKGYVVKIGNIRGYLYDFDCSAAKIKKGAVIKCRILSIDTVKKNLQLTNRTEFLKTKNVLQEASQATVDAIFTGLIVKITDQIYLVRFFNQVKGVMYKNRTGLSEIAMANLREGVISNFRVSALHGDRIIVEVATDMDANEYMGSVVKAKVECVYPTGAQIKVKKLNLTGNIPINYFTDFVTMAEPVFGAAREGQRLKVVNISNQVFSVRDVEYYETAPPLTFDAVEVGSVLKCAVKSYESGVMALVCPLKDYRRLIKLHINAILKTPVSDPDDFEITVDQPIFVRVENKIEEPKNLIVSAKLEDVWDGSPEASVGVIQKYFRDMDFMRNGYANRPIGAYRVGQEVKVTVDEYVGSHNILILQLGEVRATARNVSKPVKKGEVLDGKILWIDYARQVVEVTLNQQAMRQITEAAQTVDDAILEKKKYKGYVSLVRDDVIIVTIGENRPLVHICPRFHLNDFQPTMIGNLSNYGKCAVEVLGVVEGRLVGMFEENFKQCQGFMKLYQEKYSRKRKREPGSLLMINPDEAEAETEPAPKKLKKKGKKVIEKIDQMDGGHDMKKKERKTGIIGVKAFKRKPEVVVVKNKKLLVKQIEKSTKAAKDVAKKTLPGAENFWKKTPQPEEEMSDNDEQMTDESPATTQKGLKRLTAKSKPESAMDFDRMLTTDPDNVQLWLNYMKFHVQNGEHDRAKGVGQRALKSMNFRKEKEKLRIWHKLLDIEIAYSTSDRFYKMFTEAIAHNNPLKIYGHVFPELIKADKRTIVADLLTKMVKKHKDESEMWFIAGETYFAVDEPTKAKEALERAAKNLPPATYTELMIKFALMSNKNQHQEYAQTLFETLLSQHPARTDIWLQYVKMLIKDKLFDHVRIVFDRAVVQKIQPKRVQTLYREYLAFERANGTPATVKRVEEWSAEFSSKLSSKKN